jgi:SAM-dependent methyltransferase
MDMSVVQADFNRLAPLIDEQWSHNLHYSHWLLRHMPARCARALDLGCGTGMITRQLAARSDLVYGLDVAPRMIEIAQARSIGVPNVVFATADILRLSLKADSFDCIVSVATMHHLPLAETLLQLRQALRPGGVLLVLDLYEKESWRDMVRSLLAVPVSLSLRLWHTGRLRALASERAAWAAHARQDRYSTFSEVAQAAAEHLPGATLQKLLLWRYGLIWQRP